MTNSDWKLCTHMTQQRENLIGSGLSRLWSCSLFWNQDQKKLHEFDYCLFAPTRGLLKRIEQTDDWFTSSLDKGTFLIELGRYENKADFKSKKISSGKLGVTKADYYLIVLNKLEKVCLLNVENLKQIICRKEEQGELEIFEPNCYDNWYQKHNSLPTRNALLNIQETLNQDEDSKLIGFNELKIDKNYYENLRFTIHDH